MSQLQNSEPWQNRSFGAYRHPCFATTKAARPSCVFAASPAREGLGSPMRRGPLSQPWQQAPKSSIFPWLDVLQLSHVKFLFLFLMACSACVASNHKEKFLGKFLSGIPDWMKVQADLDLASCRGRPLSLEKICDYYETSSPDLYLIKFTIRNNRIYAEWKEKKSPGLDYRRGAYEEAFKTISEVLDLPDVTFIMSMHDAFTVSEEVPVFSMCKRQGDPWSILLPDFDALREKFQVLPNRDLTSYEPAWERKQDLLIWRGSTAQGSLDGELMRPDNVNRFSRVILCQLSQQYPELIDAKFTFFAQGGELIPYLQSFNAKQMPFENLIRYKYQLFIDGNVSPYSASGWKFFTNSLVFKVDSPFTQWYFSALRPFEHYVPVSIDLEDLVDKVQWAKRNDSEAQMIAKKCREFALSHITLPDNLLYLYYIIDQYSCLTFID